MREFHPQGQPAIHVNVDIASEHLGLTVFERQILTGGRKIRAASTEALAALSGLLTVDGVAVAEGDQILVKDQADRAANGIYVAAKSAWSREPAPAGATAFLEVQQGTVNTGTCGLRRSTRWRAAVLPGQAVGVLGPAGHGQSGPDLRSIGAGRVRHQIARVERMR